MVRSLEPCVYGGILGTIGKLYARRGALALFCGVWTYGVKDIEVLSFHEFKF